MRISWSSLGWAAAALTLAACAKPQPGPEAVVQSIYATVGPRLAHGQVTEASMLPLTPELARDYAHASTVADQRQEPFIDGDLAANCQDCTAPQDLHITMAHAPQNGAAEVQAQFKIYNEAVAVVWVMKQTPQGVWQVDNIRSPDGFDLRNSIREEIALENKSCRDDRGAEEAAQLVAQCSQVSPATHPPCKAENTCHAIESEIARSCGLLTGRKPAFCASPPASQTPAP